VPNRKKNKRNDARLRIGRNEEWRQVAGELRKDK
jgi:hypothetical protein